MKQNIPITALDQQFKLALGAGAGYEQVAFDCTPAFVKPYGFETEYPYDCGRDDRCYYHAVKHMLTSVHFAL